MLLAEEELMMLGEEVERVITHRWGVKGGLCGRGVSGVVGARLSGCVVGSLG